MAAFDIGSVDHVLATTRSVRRRIDFERAIDNNAKVEDIEAVAPFDASPQQVAMAGFGLTRL